ncbi:MAG: toll/interleukin-1 receptor domain-containing protein [Anaerolineae bacterium]|nr:toll/interleukin-1 receptor domain-containing protein [Anaerolineae bacterium]
MPDTDCQYDVFISYARVDGRDLAARLDEDLQRAGYTTWRDTRNIDPYQDFSAEIEMAIQASRYVVTCITPSIEANPDSFVRREIIYAENRQKPVIPLIFPDAGIPLLVGHLTWIPFRAADDSAVLDFDGGRERLLARIEAAPDPETRRATGDPYADYLRALYDQIVYFLNQTVFSLITLRGESDPDAVDTSRRQVLPLSFFAGAGIEPPDVARQQFEHFAHAYDHFNGRVLLLGEPGAGKTTTLMAFARDAVAARQSDPSLPLPVLGQIATWDSHAQTPLVHWLADAILALERDDLAALVKAGRALLLLDGLDELGAEREEDDPDNPDEKRRYDPRQRFMAALQDPLRSFDPTPALPAGGEGVNARAKVPPSSTGEVGRGSVIVSCRVKDYAAIGEKIALEGAVTLQPLDDEQMREYLREMPDLWAALEADDALREVARTPLLLALFTFAYRDQGDKAAELRDLRNSPGDLRDAIFRQYVEKRYAHEERRLKVRVPEAQLPFTLKEIFDVLGQLAMEDVCYSDWFGDLSENELEKDLEERQVFNLIEFAVQLHFVARYLSERLRFVHILLRDFFAFTFSVEHLLEEEWYQYVLSPDPIDALRLLRDRRATRYFLIAAGSDHPVIHSHAMVALVLQGESGVNALLKALKDENVRIRQAAAELVGEIGIARAVSTLIELLTDINPKVRGLAAKSLGELRDVRAVKPLIAALDDPNRLVLETVVISLSMLGKPAFEQVEALLQRRGNLPARFYAVVTLTRMSKTVHSRLIPLLQRLQYDSSSPIALVAATGLLDNEEPVDVRCITARLNDRRTFEDYGIGIEGRICEVACGILGRIGTPEALAALEEWRKSQETDASEDT